ncbi:MAG: aldose epimerase family protein [Candidatus Limivivens sp.]|nr:aldose epimerase family protein [Candidatus Limivivens sp.]
MEKLFFGKTGKGEEASLITLTNKNGMRVSVTDLGATLVAACVPDGKGVLTDVILGYREAKDYETYGGFFGAVIGRSGNRIGKAEFELNGKVYHLEKNEKGNNLHSGSSGFDKRIWKTELLEAENAVRFTLESPDGDEGYPGNMTASVTYTLTEDNGISLHYQAKADADTIANMTNHSYFNLAGHERQGDICDHVLWLDADSFTPTDEESIPTGEIRSVKGTPFDFTSPKQIGLEIDSDYEQIVKGGGYDHNFVLNHQGEGIRKIAEVTLPSAGRKMEVFTDLPGVQFYAGNFIGEEKTGKGGVHYGKRQGLCLETQFYPDAIHHENFPGPVLKAGELYDTTTIYRFTAE